MNQRQFTKKFGREIRFHKFKKCISTLKIDILKWHLLKNEIYRIDNTIFLGRNWGLDPYLEPILLLAGWHIRYVRKVTPHVRCPTGNFKMMDFAKIMSLKSPQKWPSDNPQNSKIIDFRDLNPKMVIFGHFCVLAYPYRPKMAILGGPKTPISLQLW